jgi:hypothetical protein
MRMIWILLMTAPMLLAAQGCHDSDSDPACACYYQTGCLPTTWGACQKAQTDPKGGPVPFGCYLSSSQPIASEYQQSLDECIASLK